MSELLGAFEKHVMPNGSNVFYRDSDHSYWRDITHHKAGVKGTGRLTGVSTVVSPYDWRPDNLMRWSARLQGQGVATLAAEGLSQDTAEDMRACLQFLTSAESIWDALAESHLLFTDIRDEAATRGTNVHKHALAALAEGKAVPEFAAMSDEEHGYARGIMAFWHELEPEPLASEQVVFHDELGVAGRFDLRARLHGSYLGRSLAGAVCMVDAKTSGSSGFIPTKHHVQLAGYDACAVSGGGEPCDQLFILQVDAAGGYKLIEVAATAEDFRVAVDLYRRAARINRESNQARKLAAAA